MSANALNQHPSTIAFLLGVAVAALVALIVALIVHSYSKKRDDARYLEGYNARIGDERAHRKAALDLAREQDQERQKAQRAQRSAQPLYPTGRYKPADTRVMKAIAAADQTAVIPAVTDADQTAVMKAIEPRDPWGNR